MQKLKLFSIKDDGNRVVCTIEKSANFFPLFSNFLLNCGITDTPYQEEYMESPPYIDDIYNHIEHFKNDDYDIDVIFTMENIILILRTDNVERVKKGIHYMTTD